MKNNNLQFKTNINCGGCVATIKPFLDNAEGIRHWEVDIASKDKLLTVHTDGISPQTVMEKVQQAGFTIELVNP